jgi:hypothetical protein
MPPIAGYGDARLARAVGALDAGDVDGLRAQLAAEPEVVRLRAEGDPRFARGYFMRPTLLHFVAQNPDRAPHMAPRVLEATAVILDAGAAVDAECGEPEQRGTTLALVASSEPAHRDGVVGPLVELLVARGADPAQGVSACVLHRYRDTARLLARLGAPPTLLWAAGLGELDLVRAGLAAGPSADARLRAGWAAALNGQAAALALLLDAGLDASAVLPRPFAPTLLHEAAWFGHVDVVELLLARGADPTRRDSEYQGTPGDWARHGGHPALAARLATPAPP